MTAAALAGTPVLLRLAVRRDRLILAIWVLVLAVLPATIAASFENLFPTEMDRQRFFITTASDGAYRALLGPGYGASLGALTTQRVGIVFLLVGLANILTVVRHTRTEEDLGRLELVRSGVAGRLAPITSALTVAIAANAALAAILALGLAANGLALQGSIVFGLSVGLTGCLFAAVAAVAAQVAQGAGGARGIAFGALGTAYLLRVVGDAGDDPRASWLSWVSPIGWMQHTRAFAGERWWLLGVAAAVAALMIAVACALAARRDVGAGLFAPGLGPPAAPMWLRSAGAFAWRLQRRATLAWLAAFAVIGLVVGGITDSAVEAMEDNEQLSRLLERLGGRASFADTYIAAVMSFLAFAAACCAIQAVLRLRTEEESSRAELVLATSVGRLRWALGHVVIGALVSLGGLAVMGTVAGLTYGLVTGDVARELPRVVSAALIQAPAVWLMGALAAALAGAWPRASGVSWFAVGACLLLGQFGAILQLPRAVVNLSPFAHTPSLPGGDVSAVTVVSLLLGTAALVTIGLAGFCRRDLSY